MKPTLLWLLLSALHVEALAANLALLIKQVFDPKFDIANPSGI
jgi:hypothetical protein